MSAILWLDDVGEAERGRVGAKAYTLALLRRQGLPVPDGFVVTAEALDPAACRAVTEAYRRLGGPVAVRSSSAREDGAAASFAGQHLTVLDVSGAEPVLEATRACFGSARDGDDYAAAVGSAPPEAMAVLIQRFVEPRAAGVAFTRDPREPASLVVESHRGRGEELVSGRVSPDRYVLDRETRAVRGSATSAGLDPDDLSRIAALALEAEARLGAPQDVEWALGAEGLVLLQSRPITAEAEPALDPRVRSLTRANVGEVLPDPVTPLTATTVVAFLEEGFRAVSQGLRPEDAPPFLVVYRRRLYLNLTLSIEVARRLPGVSADAAERLVLGGGAAGPFRGGLRPAAIARLLPVVARLLALNARLPRDVQACEEAVAGLPSSAEVEASSADGLAAHLDGFLEAGRKLATTHIATSGASGVRLALLARLLGALVPGDPMERLNRLVAALDELESARPAVEMEALAAEAAGEPEWRSWLAQPPEEAVAALGAGRVPAGLAARIEGFLGRFGHRAVSEGELRASPWRDDPRSVLSALRALLASPSPPGFRRHARREIRDADEQALFSRLGPFGRAVVGRALGQTREWVRRRERTKSLCIAAVSHGRIVARAAARRLVAAGALGDEDGVFFLTLDELRGALRGGPVDAALVERRRRLHEREAGLPVPREVDLRRTNPDRTDADEDAAPSRDRLRGVGVSGGMARGPARVAAAGPPERLEPGEVLVTTVLDAGLGPLLASAGGAVAEMGGLLSHGAVVARELGVPCAVDVRGATTRIRTGDTVEVDGGSGVVRVLGGPEPEQGEGGFLLPMPPEAEGLQDLAAVGAREGGAARESVYFNMHDAASGCVVVSSLGRRAGGRGEAVLAVGLPDGRVLFGLDRQPPRLEKGGFAVAGQATAFHPGSLRVRTRLAVHEGASLPPRPIPLLLAPRTVPFELDLSLVPAMPPVDFCQGLPEETLRALRRLGAHHLEQSGIWRGEMVVDGRRIPFEGTGSRDHSWGLREWEAADHWRLFTVALEDGLAVHALVVSARGRLVEGGFVWRGGRAERVTGVAFAGRREAGSLRSFDLEVSTAAGPPVRLTGSVLRTLTVPVDLARNPARHLRGRPYRLVLHENFTRYVCGGRAGLGMAELTERPLSAGEASA